MSRKKKRREQNLDAEWTGLCCVCGAPVNDDDGTYIGDGDHMHYDCMDAKEQKMRKDN